MRRRQRRNPYEHRPGGRHYRGQLDRIELLVSLIGILFVVLIVVLIVFVINHVR